MTHSATEPLRALTVKQPWATAIINDGKDVENRSRPTSYRGPLFIHAGKSWDKSAVPFIARITGKAYLACRAQGMVIGRVDVVDCHHADQCSSYNDEGRRTFCAPWAMADHYHWVLANPAPIKPVPAKGKLGIWKLPAL